MNIFKEKVSREIRELPSMMWKKYIVQVRGRSARAAALAQALALLLFASVVRGSSGADLVIEIPGSGGAGDAEAGHYRLDYRPPHGSPAPNFTVPAQASTINFQGRPGTKYHFMLYYSNATFADLLTWNQTIITAPEPPTNLTVALGRNKQATISWSPPAHGDYSGFRFKVAPVSERAEGGARNITVEGAGGWSHTLRDLSPGATYQLHAFTLLQDKESAAYASRNFTTKPNTPGKFIVWFRNETTLLVLWQPPYPPGAYTHYKVSIVPADARESELYVEKEGEPPGPAQAAFKGLVPGRPYNISVQTVSEPEISAPTTAQYRTVPLRPLNLTLLPHSLTETGFTVTWLPPQDVSEFEKYQVSVSGGGGRRPAPVLRGRGEPLQAEFSALEPGDHYAVSVKTMSGKVTSWPTGLDLTLKPLPVVGVSWQPAGDGVVLAWSPQPGSTQDQYKVSYHESGPMREDSNSLMTSSTNITLDALLPGRNYTITVTAVSRGVESNETSWWAATRPLAPVLRAAAPAARRLSLAWRSDVNSRQDRYLVTLRRPPDPPTTMETVENNIEIGDLFPGAVYEIQLVAVSHGLRSEPYVQLKPVRPLPPSSLGVERVTSNSVVVVWRGPLQPSAVGQFVLRYRTQAQAGWTRLPPLPPNTTEAEIVDMTHGERYSITLDTASEVGAGEPVESNQPLMADHTVRPNPVSNVASLVDTRNMTLEWPQVKGRVEWYSLRCQRLGSRDPPLARNISAAEAGAGGAGGAGRVVVGGLWPGAGYSLSIATHSYNLTSDQFTMQSRTRPLIQSEMTIVNENDAGDGDGNDTLPALVVIYTRTPLSVSEFDSYRFRLEWARGPAADTWRAADAPAQTVAFRGLAPGALYNVTMWTVSRNVSSHPVQRQARLFPRPITGLNASEITATSITLEWQPPAGVWSDFEVVWLEAGDSLQSRSSAAPRLTARPLRPHARYTFTVEARAGSAASLLTRAPAVSASFRTRQAPPAAPSSFAPTDARPRQLTFSWDLPPEDVHGELKKFIIEYWLQGHEDSPMVVEFPPDARNGTVSELAPGGTYEFRLAGETGAGRGAAAAWSAQLAIAAPPRPPPAAAPARAAASPTTLAVRFRSDYFSQANGNVTAYTLVLSEEPRNDTPARLPSWRDVQQLPVWPPYQVTEPYYPFHSSAVEEFTIGSERCEAGGRAYCNGPLKPGTKYYVKLRAFTAPDKFTDTAYTLVYTEVDNTAWIVGACVVVGALGAALLAALLARRRRAPPAAAPPAAQRRVRLQDFADHYRLMSADSDFRFSEEFEELKHVGREQSCAAAELPCNRPKNRFTNILPYDHSRFKLQPVDDEEGSDYINANYVPGFNSPREFIVTQGPLHSTRDDFWRMAWESGSRAIVMLTRCVEKGREKCDRYWPFDTRPVYYGDICVTALNESRFPDWTVTELMVCRGAEQRVVKHFHFTTWPDFGVPDPPTTLVRFVRAFRERCGSGPDARPVLVHCSAGVGRSGTFVTLDTALQQLQAHVEYIDIFGMVWAMRRERVWMVQTEQQYICVHQCLVAVLEGQDLSSPPKHHHLNQAFEDDEGIAESGM